MRIILTNRPATASDRHQSPFMLGIILFNQPFCLTNLPGDGIVEGSVVFAGLYKASRLWN
jgi:hypothetical protein